MHVLRFLGVRRRLSASCWLALLSGVLLYYKDAKERQLHAFWLEAEVKVVACFQVLSRVSFLWNMVTEERAG